MIIKVISGGQTGADQAGLAAAKHCGIRTGGFAPKGWRTLNGSQPKLKDYGLTEYDSPNYKDRTWANVYAADATIRFASNFNSAGEKCTINAIINYDKPFFDVNVPIDESNLDKLVEWIKRNNFRILNIAGNSEKTSPGIYNHVSKFLVKVFKSL